MSLASLATHALTLQRPGVDKDLSGGPTRTFQDVANKANLPCSLQPAGRQERMAFGARQLFLTHKAYFPADPTARKGDRFLEESTGRTFVVLSFEDQAGRGEVFCAHLREQLPHP